MTHAFGKVAGESVLGMAGLSVLQSREQGRAIKKPVIWQGLSGAGTQNRTDP